MRKRKITFSVPRLNDEKAIIEENVQLLDVFFNQCGDSPEKIIESDIQSFFDAMLNWKASKERLFRVNGDITVS